MRTRAVLHVVLPLLAGSLSLLPAQEPKQLLESEPLVNAVRLELQLHAGEYHLVSSSDDRLHVFEVRDSQGVARRATEVSLRSGKSGSRLEIDPPLNNHGETRITVALPHCAELKLQLTAGELILETVRCEVTDIDIHAGELRASLGDMGAFRRARGSVTIGQVETKALSPGRPDEQHGGFFRSFEQNGTGTKSFSAHIGSGHILLEHRSE